MFRADTMPRSYNPALEQRERRFYGVGCYHEVMFVSDILFRRVVHGFVLRFQFAESLRIGREVIGDNNVNVAVDVLLNILRQSATLGIFCVEEPQVAAALANANYDFFGVPLAPPSLPVTMTLPPT